MSNATRTRADKPDKPYPDFPLFPHATRRWAKKIRGKMHYFGPWEDPPAALTRYLEARDDLHAGRVHRYAGDGYTVRDLVNAFLNVKRNRVNGGELTLLSWRDYFATCQIVVSFLGKTRLVEDLTPDDFEQLKVELAKGRGPITVGNHVNRVKVVFNWAFEQGKIEKPVRYGPEFRLPTQKTVRLERAKRGVRMFEADELRKILSAAPQPMKAMVLLGLNAGLGNTDVANLQFFHLDLAAGWLTFPRPKTGVGRRCPLWSETLAAIREAIASRPAPAEAADGECVFLTPRGRRCVLIRAKHMPDVDGGVTDRGKKPPLARVDAVTRQFGNLLKGLGIAGQRNFYALRHTFETIAGESRDQVAVDVIMGHADHTIGGVYRERVSDARLQDVAKTVRAWLWSTT